MPMHNTRPMRYKRGESFVSCKLNTNPTHIKYSIGRTNILFCRSILTLCNTGKRKRKKRYGGES